jgi:hypothetical protein
MPTATATITASTTTVMCIAQRDDVRYATVLVEHDLARVSDAAI